MNTPETVEGGPRLPRHPRYDSAMTSFRPTSKIAFAIAAGLIAVGCGSSSESSGDSAPSDPPAAEADTPTDTADANVVDEQAIPGEAPGILQFTSPLVGGGEIDAAELSDKPTAFWFWSPT